MSSFQRLLIYLKMFTKAMIHTPSLTTLKGCVKYLPHWWRHLNEGKNSVSDNLPWLTFGAIMFLKKVLRPDMVVFEYGSGGSTLFWAEHVAEVVSIEHDRAWYEKMTNEFLKREMQNIEYILAEAENKANFSDKNYANPKHYVSEDSRFVTKTFEHYVKQIDRFPNQSFDIIVVDGRARPSCILHSLDKLKEGGYLIVDNTERNYYLSSFKFDNSHWNIWEFRGPVPYIYHFSETTIFQKKIL